MKLYQAKVITTCPRRVTIYMAEKGIDCEIVTIDMRAGEGRSAAFLAKNPAGRVPVLELDDGSFLPESAAIVEYLEELYPDPPMIGRTPEERAHIRSRERLIMDFQIYQNQYLLHHDDSTQKRRPSFVRYPAVSDAMRPIRDYLFQAIETQFGDGPYFGGTNVTVADISLFAILDTNEVYFNDFAIPDSYPKLQRWYNSFKSRPSAARPPAQPTVA